MAVQGKHRAYYVVLGLALTGLAADQLFLNGELGHQESAAAPVEQDTQSGPQKFSDARLPDQQARTRIANVLRSVHDASLAAPESDHASYEDLANPFVVFETTQREAVTNSTNEPEVERQMLAADFLNQYDLKFATQSGDSQFAVVQNIADQDDRRRIAIGDTIDGFRLVAFIPDGVVFTRGQERVVLPFRKRLDHPISP